MFSKSQRKKIVFLSPHVDDAVIACGGTLALLCEQSHEVYHICFSFSEKSIPDGYSEDVTKKELLRASKVLGISSKNLIFHEYETRCFDMFRQNILEDLYKFNKEFNPDVVFLPSTYDLHQDHAVISMEGIRAFKYKTIFGYEMPLNNMKFSADGFITLDQQHVDKRQNAWRCFDSQIGKRSMNYTEPLARVRGEQAGGEYAEAFEVIRLVL